MNIFNKLKSYKLQQNNVLIFGIQKFSMKMRIDQIYRIKCNLYFTTNIKQNVIAY